MSTKIFRLLLILVLALSGCESSAPVLGKKPVKRVYLAENDADELRIWTDIRARANVLVHIDATDDLAIFPKSIMDSIEATAKSISKGDIMAVGRISSYVELSSLATVGYMAGMFDRVVWVIPAGRPTGEEDPEVFRRFFLESRKFPKESVGEFISEGSSVSGTLAGIPLEITRLEELKLRPKEKAIVDLDMRYFTLLAKQKAGYKTGIQSLLSFLRALAAADLRVKAMTVNLATQSNEVPMDLRYYGKVIVEAMADPKLLEPPMPDKWRLVSQAEDSMRVGKFAQAAALYREALKLDPENPGLHFALGVALGFDEKGMESRQPLIDAYRLDHEYLRGIFHLARQLGAAGKVNTGLEILDSPDLKKMLGEAEMDYQRGVFYYSSGRPYDAATYLSKVSSSRGRDFGLYTILFRAYREIGDVPRERDAMQRLIDIDEGRVRREMPWVYIDLGSLYEKTGYIGNAKDLYKKYAELFPSDSRSPALKKRADSLNAVLETWRRK